MPSKKQKMRRLPPISIYLLFLMMFSCTTPKEIISSDLLGDTSNWVVEQQPGGEVLFTKNQIEINDSRGCTVWLKQKLKGNIKISYDVTVIDEGGPYDRVSDLNCFWMASDPKHPDNFFMASRRRMGLFPNYHELKLYYVGYGGHNNSKTRFRRYNGDKDRPLLPEHDLSDKKYMIVPNKKMHIELVANGSEIKYIRDKEIIFEINDPEPYTSGYFGFRTVNNHLKISNFKVIEL